MAIDIKNDKIIITRNEAGKPNMEVEGLWGGKDRRIIGRMLWRKTQEARRLYKKSVKGQAKKEEQQDKRVAALAKARAAKAAKAAEAKENIKEEVN